MTNTPAPKQRSTIRYITALVSLLAAMVTILAGFFFMVRALESGGYGTSRNTLALAWLGAGGAFLGIGIVLLIWELSVRHNVRH